MEDGQKQAVNFQIDKEAYNQIKQYTKDNYMTMTGFYVKAINDLLAKSKPGRRNSSVKKLIILKEKIFELFHGLPTNERIVAKENIEQAFEEYLRKLEEDL